MGISNEFDLIQAISGCDEFGNSKCNISVMLQYQDSDGNLKNIEDDFMTSKPIVQISKQLNGYVLMDLIFESREDIDLKIIYSYLKRFFDSSMSVNDDETEFPLFTIAIVPEELAGEYWVMGLNPIFYTLTPDDVDGEPKIIRPLFVSQPDPDSLPNFLFMRSDSEELDAIGDITEEELN